MNDEAPDQNGRVESSGDAAGKASKTASKVNSVVRRIGRGSLIAIGITLALVAAWAYTFDEGLRDEPLYLFSLIGVLSSAAIDAVWARLRK